MDIRTQIEDLEASTLSEQATLSRDTRGREHPEAPHPLRTDFQRDRDRILHSKAFRRLAHKTQVFLAPEGDHYRVRLTHTLEVTQIARTIARALRLNEDLTEAICLGHDLGHTPFGHLGEEVLSEFLGKPFKHNEQSIRVVKPLNLTWEVLDGILNHTWSMPEPATPEAQVARYADRIAYISHDIDDAIRAGVLTEDELPPRVVEILGSTSSDRIDTLVTAVVETGRPAMDPEIFDVMIEAREFLFKQVYTRPGVQAEHARARALLRAICEHYASEGYSEEHLVDYVAGMTDRFAQREYDNLGFASP